MKIAIISGSPHKKGTSALLVESFIRGAEESGHEVSRFDAAFANMRGCIGCDHCRRTDGTCVFNDDMTELRPKLIEADAIIFATPVYYFGLSSQLKSVIDRFYAFEEDMRGNKKAGLLVTAASPNESITHNAVSVYEDIIDWMKWENAGEVLAFGCAVPADIEGSQYVEQAYELGRGIFR